MSGQASAKFSQSSFVLFLSQRIYIMKSYPRHLTLAAPAFLALSLCSPCLADFTGFGDFSGFTLNQADAGSPPAITPNTIQLSSGGNQYRSIFRTTRQSVGQFTASFSYRAATDVRNMGVTFVLENAPAGAGALGSGFASFGYTGISNSVGVTLEGEFQGNISHSGVYSGGVIGGGSLPTSPVFLSSGHWINVVLSYNGSILSESLTDTVTSQTYNTSAFLNIPALVGGPAAFVGIASASGNNGQAYSQFVSDLRFSTVPQPAAATMFGMAGLTAMRRRRPIA